MQGDIEKVISRVYKIWKEKFPQSAGNCPDEETLACFLEDRLPSQESQQLKDHIITCEQCQEIIRLVSAGATEKNEPVLLEIILAFKDKVIDLIRTSGDVLYGQEFAPLPVLRSRNIKDFGQEVIIVEDIGNIKAEIEIENKANYIARITVKLTDINTGKPSEGLRVSLIRQEQEIESYIAEAGQAVFDNILADNYSLEISSPELIIGKILLEIKKE
mgnify:FL=1